MKIKLNHLYEAINTLRWEVSYDESLPNMNVTVEITEESIEDGNMLSCVTFSLERDKESLISESSSSETLVARKVTIFPYNEGMLPTLSKSQVKTIKITTSN
jgi:hypothetical protein